MTGLFKATHRIYPLDIDGNRLASFWGYDCPSISEIFNKIPECVKIFVYDRSGRIVECITP